MAYTQARALKDEEWEWKAKLMDICQEENIPNVAEWIELAIGECYDWVASYDKRPVARIEAADSDIQWEGEFVLHLKVPHTFPSMALRAMTKQMHAYVCSRVLEEFTGLILPELAEGWAVKSQEAMAKIEDIAKARTVMPKIKDNIF